MRSFTKVVSFTVLSLFTLASCTQNNLGKAGSTPKLKTASSDDIPDLPPKAGEEDSVDARLSRFTGQKSFLNYTPIYAAQPMPKNAARGMAFEAAAPQAAAARMGADNKQTESFSDVFQFLKSGLLALLNPVRGLQFVKFTGQADTLKATLEGRVEPTRFNPDDMYYDEVLDRLYVIERRALTPQETSSKAERFSRIVVYNTDPKDPKILSTYKLTGEMADSRKLDDVLYIVTSEYDYEHAENSKGHIYSFKLTNDDKEPIKQLGTIETSQPINLETKNLNIVEQKEADAKYHYYLLATMAKSPYAYLGDQSSVEIVDISNPEAMEAVMTVTTRGVLEKKDQTLLRGHRLIAASTYKNQGFSEVAVESFTFPKKNGAGPGITDEIIDNDELTRRKLNIAKKLKSFTNLTTKQLAEKYSELVAGKEPGLEPLQGRFIAQGNGRYQKVVADTFDALWGGSREIDLKDVRSSNQFLYVTWTPEDSWRSVGTGPYAVLDMSGLESGKGMKEATKGTFMGTLQRIIPTNYKGRELVLQLGYSAPMLNNPDHVQVPQVTLAEMVQRRGHWRLDPIAELQAGEENAWVNVGNEDKFVTTAFNPDGTGYILFQINVYRGKSFSGGKLIGFDLNKGDDAALAEGPRLPAEVGFLKRVFANKNYASVFNTFSQYALGTYRVSALNAARAAADTVNVLELARNIRAYVALKDKDTLRGVQIIDRSSYDYGSAKEGLQLRVVDATKADSELEPGKTTVKDIEGTYADHKETADTSLILTTGKTNTIAIQNSNPPAWKTEQEYFLHKLTLVDGKPVVATHTWTGSPATYQGPIFAFDAPEARVMASRFRGDAARTSIRFPHPRTAAAKLVRLPQGQLVVNTGKDIFTVSEANLATTLIATDKCLPPDAKADVSVEVIDGSLFATWSLKVLDPKREYSDTVFEQGKPEKVVRKPLYYQAHYVAEAKLSTVDNKPVLTCGPGINVPGKVVHAVAGKHIVVQDQRLWKLREERKPILDKDDKKIDEFIEWKYDLRSDVVMSLAVFEEDKKQKAKIADLKSPRIGNFYNSVYLKKTGENNDTLVFFEEKQNESDDWASLLFLGFDDQYHFAWRHRADVKLGSGVHSPVLTQIIPTKTPQNETKYLGVVSVGGPLARAQVIEWSDKDMTPELKTLIPLDPAFREEPETTTISGVGSGSWFGSSGERFNVHYTEATKTFEFVEGAYGIKQVKVKN